MLFKMADGDINRVKVLCDFCNSKAVNKRLRCANCLKWYHNSCATKKSKDCCEKPCLQADIQDLSKRGKDDLQDEHEEIKELQIQIDTLKIENGFLTETNINQKRRISQLEMEVERLKVSRSNSPVKVGNASEPGVDYTNIETIVEAAIQKSLSNVNKQLLEIQNVLEKQIAGAKSFIKFDSRDEDHLLSHKNDEHQKTALNKKT